MRRVVLALVLTVVAALAPSHVRAQREGAPRRPHILFVLADDLGWNDVGYHGSEIKTPTLDRMARSGVRLEQFYAMPVCTPTRAALMTGRYPMRYGLQSGVNRPWSQWGLPVEERLLPQALKQADYHTAITGKWHLGHAQPAYLPTRRGFDHQYGEYCGAIDYFRHERDGGHDWHRNDRALIEEGYSTELIGAEAARVIEGHDPSRPLFLYVAFNAPHTPLQAPESYVKRYEHISNPRRRTYAAMVTRLDDNLAKILAALDRKGMTCDTLVVFSSDNGGQIRDGADNSPLRGAKGEHYEGGVRVPAWAVWPGKLKAGTVVETPLHVVDWHATLLRLAGAKPLAERALDGKDLWPVLTGGKAPARDDILLNVEPHRGALRAGDWKLVARGRLPGEPSRRRTWQRSIPNGSGTSWRG
jgi:arylsulfatase A-like enzyme